MTQKVFFEIEFSMGASAGPSFYLRNRKKNRVPNHRMRKAKKKHSIC